MSFTTAQLAQAVGGELYGDQTVQCCGAEIDTRRCVANKVFFALHGTNVDGHAFLDDAVAGGCSAVVVEQQCALPVPFVVVKDTRKALYQLALKRRSAINVKQVIAVTGSVGKTTTKDLLAVLLGDKTTASILSFNNDLGVPLTILDAEDSDYLVCEVGSNAVGEIEPLARLIQPDIAVITSIDKAHLEGFGDQETILQEKAKLLSTLSKSGIAIIPDTIDLSNVHISATVCKVGTSNDADVKIAYGVNHEGFAELAFAGHRVTLSLLGAHNAINAALAIVAAHYAFTRVGQPRSWNELLDAIIAVQGPKGRLRRLHVGNVTFLDDTYNANPASMRAALQLFSTMKNDRKVVILGDMLELGDSTHAEHRSLAHAIGRSGADLIILVGTAMEAASHIPACVYESEADDETIARIVSLIRPKDTVLIKGSRGLHLERIIETMRMQQRKVSQR